MTDPTPGQRSRRPSPGEAARGRGEGGVTAWSGKDAPNGDSVMPYRPAKKWARGLTWARSPNALIIAGLLISVLLLAVVVLVQFVLAPATAVTIGIVLV